MFEIQPQLDLSSSVPVSHCLRNSLFLMHPQRCARNTTSIWPIPLKRKLSEILLSLRGKHETKYSL